MKKISEIILNQIEQYNENLDEKVDLSEGEDTILFGQGGVLDSVDFVTLIIDIEQAVNDEYGENIVISNSRAMSRKNSPFRTVGTLADYIKELLEK
ncbi:MAG: acyl carrier protein [Selenomonadaceae bacterium]|nr:acyl carrier protein [Selenomonadaceae bacterium]